MFSYLSSFGLRSCKVRCTTIHHQVKLADTFHGKIFVIKMVYVTKKLFRSRISTLLHILLCARVVHNFHTKIWIWQLSSWLLWMNGMEWKLLLQKCKHLEKKYLFDFFLSKNVVIAHKVCEFFSQKFTARKSKLSGSVKWLDNIGLHNRTTSLIYPSFCLCKHESLRRSLSEPLWTIEKISRT